MVARPRFLPKVLLVQVRESEIPLFHERACFERVCDGRAELSYHNLIDDPELEWASVRRYEVLMVGGSGECSATKSYEFTESLEAAVTRWVQESRPFFGSCWGHHFLAAALGGTVRSDPDTEEVGTFPVRLSPAARRDPLFSAMPMRFQAQMGHHDSVTELPEGVESLADSERCPHQVLKVVDKPIYSTQFHSELGRRQIIERLEMYKSCYLDHTSLNEMTEQVRPSPAIRPLVSRFLELYT